MADNEVVFTYETLYELFRREKNKEELQKIDDKFYQEALSYLKEKQDLYDETLKKDDLFSVNERESLHTQINNIRKLLKDFYDKRERKIINMAINAVKINKNVIDTSTLLPLEKELYERIIDVLEQSRKEILLNVLMLRQPTQTSTEEHKKEEKKNETEMQEHKDKKTEEGDKQERTTIKTVRFKEKTEQFIGKNLEVYGPFSQDDTAKLPSEIAKILITQGKAEEVKET
ncbi:hypothetical protein DRJ25_00645 [Candidatus Woesearchaeota archaeon]|nr:MAG: hypothetical protein DRJ25_00645 [Candidatus Woesearchaeota archaeon]